MYAIDKDTRVIELSDLPAQSAGAPMPRVFATDNDVILAYETAPAGDDIAILGFVNPRAHSFGSPNDEALSGHPLYHLGLRAYGNFEVLGSPWARELERRNRVHPRHDASRFEALRHFVFTFHDRMFECLALSVTKLDLIRNDAGSDQKLLKLVANKLRFNI